MYWVVALFVGIILLLLFLAHANSEILTNVRAFVEGESLWSKGQKDAIVFLNKYALSQSETDYQAFLEAIAIPLGDKQARLELEKAEPHMPVAYAGFVIGGNHPDDVAGMAGFFVRYRHVSYLEKAIGIWAEGDRQIGTLLVLATRLQQLINSGNAGSKEIQNIRRQLDAVNLSLSGLEKQFSATLGEAARWVAKLTRLLIYLSSAFLLLVGMACSFWLIKRMRKMELALIDSEARFRRVVESNMIGIVFWEKDGKITDANDAFLQLIGYGIDDLHGGGINWKALTPGEYEDRDRQALAEIAAMGSCACYEKEYIRKDGNRVPVCLGAAQLEGNPDRGVCFVLDISERRRAEEQFRLAAKVMEYSSKAIVVANAHGDIIAVNRAFSWITSYRDDEILGKNLGVLDAKRRGLLCFQDVLDHAKASGQWQGEILGQRKDGEVYAQWLGMSPVVSPQGEITHYVGIFSDITERKAAEERIFHQARHDFLTGLPNRILLDEKVCGAIDYANRNGAKLAVLFIDLDGFKAVNDTLGHQVGDKLLQIVAERLMANVRASDHTVCRQGGDEFVVLLEGIKTRRNAFIVADKLVRAIEQACLIGGQEIHISASVGVGIYPDDAQDFATLMRHADLAMYQTKQARKIGRQTFKRGKA